MSNQFDDAADWLQDEVDYDVEELAMNCLSEFVNLSPVDTGRFRGNWIVTVDKDTDKIRESIVSDPYKLGQAVINRAIKSGADLDYILISNNLSYAAVIDDGLYPNPVSVGSRTNETGARQNPITPIYEKLSSNGFSKLATNGVTRPGIKAALERSKGR